LRQSLAIWEATLPHLHPNIATAMHDLARLYLIQHKYSQARPLLERLVANREEALGANDPALLSPLRALAELHIAERRYTAAEPLYMHLLCIQQKALGQEHSAYAADLERYAFVLRKLKRKKEAAVAERSILSARTTFLEERR